ncbi:MAG: hypothetical protein Q9227_001948 [Pyrenula ochraceoflavens]
MASRAYGRLKNAHDEYMDFVYRLIFKMARSPPSGGPDPQPPLETGTAQHIMAIFRKFALLNRVSNREDADIRYYCDNDRRDASSPFPLSRWSLRPDPPNPPPYYIQQWARPKLQRSAGEPFQEWEDLDNVKYLSLLPETAFPDAPGVSSLDWLTARLDVVIFQEFFHSLDPPSEP